MERYYYKSDIANFINASEAAILGEMASNNSFTLETSQRDAWREEILILKSALMPFSGQGRIYFEYSVPRLGKRIDVVAAVGRVLFILEFKVGERDFPAQAIDQVWDYALDLKNFHETSHHCTIAPVLIATAAQPKNISIATTQMHDSLIFPIKTGTEKLSEVIRQVLLTFTEGSVIDPDIWEQGRYSPTPTIVEAAMALYGGHSVGEISRRDASAVNLNATSDCITQIIKTSKTKGYKSVCLLTGVPGAGKTLVGLNIATKHTDKNNDLYSVFLSGNGPLVAVLRKALARDKVRREKDAGRRMKESEAMSEVKMFIQNVHNFRDECLIDLGRPPIEHVALFDEAQRAWNLEQTSSFMRRKKHIANFDQSEPEFLLSCMDRHSDWAVVVCLVGGGQEINTGEAGISEWIESLLRKFPDWYIYASSRLTDSEYAAGKALELLKGRRNFQTVDELHLSVSMRSFRAENVSLLVKQMLDLDENAANKTRQQVEATYPIVITRSVQKAKDWLRQKARGSERYGIVVSSQALRLKPDAIDVRSPMDPIHWFLNGKEDVRSSYYLEDVATEFHVQGLELDWACVTWDADFRYAQAGWEHWSFCGDRWNHIRKVERQTYQKNAYRVLLTRARQGMVVVVPPGDAADPTRNPAFYDPIYGYLQRLGFNEI
ncbi:MAG: DUF2075 domain-containing protein [Phycisphaerales bacterium]|nr:DUF2075 domain-containing protein [Phycisphaerales bacterium]